MMLHTISWWQFGSFLLISLLIYYGYVGLAYYRSELWARFAELAMGRRGRKGGVAYKGALSKSAGVGIQEMMEGGRDTQRGVSDADTQERGETELFKASEKLMGRLGAMLKEAEAFRISRAELDERVRDMLSLYRQLIGTPHQVAVIQYIVRQCIGWMAPPVLAEEVAELWI